MIYGYARVSSTDQNLSRQFDALKEYISDDRFIITDKASGKDFNRKGYNSLVGTENTAPILHKGDLLIILSLDRLGRNYKEIREQWQLITQTIGADIKVLDMPLLDTSKSSNSLDGRFIADLVMQILSYVAEKERENTHKRQEQGINAMQIIDGKRVSSKTGKPIGRPEAEYPGNWEEVYKQWTDKQITATKAMEILELKRNTFYKLANKYKAELLTT